MRRDNTFANELIESEEETRYIGIRYIKRRGEFTMITMITMNVNIVPVVEEEYTYGKKFRYEFVVDEARWFDGNINGYLSR